MAKKLYIDEIKKYEKRARKILLFNVFVWIIDDQYYHITRNILTASKNDL